MQGSITVDVEPDCPPFLKGYRGIEEGLAPLLALLAEERVRATFFTTGDVARRYPDQMRQIVAAGHELGCHGDSHRSFARLTAAEAEAEIAEASATLRQFAAVTSFRAPFLSFPPAYLPLLGRAGYQLDSSHTRYKWPRGRPERAPLRRVPASAPSSLLRLPAWLRDPILDRLSGPAVLFVHPWEFVDLRRARLRADCRFRTGRGALDGLRASVRRLRARGVELVPMAELS
jgi:peptidoglycan/xylan/chitin deacetylase (PgdA/CDA1 family)